MKTIASLLLFLCFAPSQSFSAVLTFEEFAPYADVACCDFFEVGHATAFLYGEANRDRYGGVTWDSPWVFATENLIAYATHSSDYWCTTSTQSFLHPHSGDFALFNPLGYDDMGFSTPEILTGVWFARPTLEDRPGGAVQVTVTAFAGASAVASVSLSLVDTAWVFMDTSVFLLHDGITRYVVSRLPQPSDLPISCPDPGYYVADDFQFASASLVDLCPCDGPWRSHAEFIRCFHRALLALVKEDALTRRQAGDLFRAAAESDCGQHGKTK